MGGGSEEVMREFQAIPDGGKANARNWSLDPYSCFSSVPPLLARNQEQTRLRSILLADLAVPFAIEKSRRSATGRRLEIVEPARAALHRTRKQNNVSILN